MARKFDILVLSLFGRNHWLASQLKSSGHSVALFDLTPQFQKGLAEDWEGPFPLIFPDHVARSYSQSFIDQDRTDILHRGPSLRLKGRGLLEFKSDHAPHMIEKMGQQGIWLAEELGLPQLKTQDMEFSELWLKSFLKQWRSTTLKSLRATESLVPEFPLNSNYVLRSPSRRGYMESSGWLKDTGVEVIDSTSWWKCTSVKGKWNFSFGAGPSDSSDSSEDNFQIETQKLILGLTSYELYKFSGQLQYPGFDITYPEAFWVRWRGSVLGTVQGMPALDFIPSYSMFFSEPEFGVYSENFMTVIKRSATEVDVWACLSREALSNFEFQMGLQKSIQSKLKQFVPELESLVLDELRMGSDLYSFWPQYRERKPIQDAKLGLFIDSPESWWGLDNYSRYMFQLNMIETLNKLKSESTLKELR